MYKVTTKITNATTFIFLVNANKCIQGKINSTDIETFVENEKKIDDCLSEFTICNMWGK